MPAEPIRYFHRAKQVVETEKVYGEKWVRWTYESKGGSLLLHALAKRHIASWYYGWRMNRPSSANKVLPFIVEYDLDVDEFAKSAFLFKTFNDFFYRALKPGARPIADVDRKLAHELSDCLWSVLVLAKLYGCDLEKEFLKTMDELEQDTAKNQSY